MDNGPAVGDLGHRVGNWLRVIPPASIRMGQYQMGMVVKLFLCSGGERTVDAADSARFVPSMCVDSAATFVRTLEGSIPTR